MKLRDILMNLSECARLGRSNPRTLMPPLLLNVAAPKTGALLCRLLGRIVIRCGLALPTSVALAVSPLTTDDADTVERGRLQLTTGWQFSRTASVHSHTLPVNLVLGITGRVELGATFGYQWLENSSAGTPDTDGITDLTLATKWKLWQSENEQFKFSARLDLKLPTASGSRGLGTEHTDVGLGLIATRHWGKTDVDWNAGFTATDAGGNVFDADDQWFLGQAIRHQLNDRWTLIGETYLLLPHGNDGGDVNFYFNGGAQFNVRENLLLSVMIGSAIGKNSPDLTGYLGLTCLF